MRKLLVFVAVVGMVVALGGVALAGNNGECSYGSHNQAATDKIDATKTVATKAPETTDASKVVIAQTEKPAQPGSEVKK